MPHRRAARRVVVACASVEVTELVGVELRPDARDATVGTELQREHQLRAAVAAHDDAGRAVDAYEIDDRARCEPLREVDEEAGAAFGTDDRPARRTAARAAVVELH